jgi:hypothetical protein
MSSEKSSNASAIKKLIFVHDYSDWTILATFSDETLSRKADELLLRSSV